jgi:RNA polymerase sigma-70 factor (ECF subfamily)
MAELVGRYKQPLYRFLVSMVRDAQLAEDLFQETFLRFHRYRASYAPHCQLKPYLYRIATNVAREACARRSTGRPTTSLNGDSSNPPLRERIAGQSPDPSGASEDHETQMQVRSAVEQLPDAEREVVHLRLFEDMTFPQIAIATGVSIGTAQSRMVYALRRLRRLLKVRVQAPGESTDPQGAPRLKGGGQ